MRILRKIRPTAILCLLIGTAAAGQPSATQAPLSVWAAPKTGMVFVLLDAGSFTMGSPSTESMREEQETPHRVTLTRAFWIGRYEVTQAQWRQVMGSSPGYFTDCGPDCPVEDVSGYEVREFLGKLSALEGRSFRLPTEAEWEYACRAGTTRPFSTGAGITTDQANFDGRYPYPWSERVWGEFRRTPTPVGSFAPNAWGLHDLHGNVWEWTADPHCPYPEGALTDPHGSCDNEILVIRGGSWTFGADSMRCALRYTHHPRDRGPSLGLRVARDR